jgi:oxygen-independent coproporphyrinogen-3 oxidase
MRTLDATAVDIAAAIGDDITADYVYMYPPRQAYREVSSEELDPAVVRSLERGGTLNLYIHVPFCRQICAFCNLYAVASRDETLFERYIDALIAEARWYAPHASGRPVSTLYLGGGTPSQLSAAQLDRLMTGLEAILDFDRGAVTEVALEVAPDTVTGARLIEYRDIGINRINLGLQSAADAELRSIGRRQDARAATAAVATAVAAGFENVCVDLIYGLEGQSMDSWAASVDTAIALAPPTICAYALTLRPRTGYAARGYRSVVAGEQYAKYDYAHAALTAAGYVQETHVRWSRASMGGYVQKANHWALGSVLGLGAGARGYLWDCDYRNGYSAASRRPVLRDWFERVDRLGHGRLDGYLMDRDERVRKATILGLGHLDRQWARAVVGEDPVVRFAAELSALERAGAVIVDESSVRLTALGQRHRDVVVQAFFSETVRQLVRDHDYRHG